MLEANKHRVVYSDAFVNNVRRADTYEKLQWEFELGGNKELEKVFQNNVAKVMKS